MVPILTAQRFSLHRFQPLEQQTEPGHMRVRLKAVRFIREGYLAPTVADTLGNTDERVHRSVWPMGIKGRPGASIPGQSPGTLPSKFLPRSSTNFNVEAAAIAPAAVIYGESANEDTRVFQAVWHDRSGIPMS